MRARALSAALAILLGAGAACGGSAADPETAPRVEVPDREPTVGDQFARAVPAGADLVAELDLARLRASPVLGPLVSALAENADRPDALTGVLAPGREFLARTDALFMVAYHVGEERAASIILVRGDVPMGEEIGPRLYALGPPEWVARARAAHAGEAPSLAEDRALMAVRTRAMPRAAPGAFLRAAARLDFDARVELAGRLELASVPETVSLWADVADDLAVVATLAAEPGQGAAMARDLESLRERVANLSWVRQRYLHFTLRSIDISAADSSARAVLVIAPQRLQRMIARLAKALESASPSSSATPHTGQ